MANAYVLEMNANYFPSEGGLSSTYADTNSVLTQGQQVVAGVAIYQKLNRIAPAIYAINPDGSGGQWIKGPQGNDNNYFPKEGGLSQIYADTNPVKCSAGQVVRGIQFYQTYEPGPTNRVAVQIWCTNPDGSNARWINSNPSSPSNPNYFPQYGGLSQVYADSNEVRLLNANLVYGIVFWAKNNRLAISAFV